MKTDEFERLRREHDLRIAHRRPVRRRWWFFRWLRWLG
jgi:hypothetical protein